MATTRSQSPIRQYSNSCTNEKKEESVKKLHASYLNKIDKLVLKNIHYFATLNETNKNDDAYRNGYYYYWTTREELRHRISKITSIGIQSIDRAIAKMTRLKIIISEKLGFADSGRGHQRMSWFRLGDNFHEGLLNHLNVAGQKKKEKIVSDNISDNIHHYIKNKKNINISSSLKNLQDLDSENRAGQEETTHREIVLGENKPKAMHQTNEVLAELDEIIKFWNGQTNAIEIKPSENRDFLLILNFKRLREQFTSENIQIAIRRYFERLNAKTKYDTKYSFDKFLRKATFKDWPVLQYFQNDYKLKSQETDVIEVILDEFKKSGRAAYHAKDKLNETVGPEIVAKVQKIGGWYNLFTRIDVNDKDLRKNMLNKILRETTVEIAETKNLIVEQGILFEHQSIEREKNEHCTLDVNNFLLSLVKLHEK